MARLSARDRVAAGKPWTFARRAAQAAVGKAAPQPPKAVAKALGRQGQRASVGAKLHLALAAENAARGVIPHQGKEEQIRAAERMHSEELRKARMFPGRKPGVAYRLMSELVKE